MTSIDTGNNEKKTEKDKILPKDAQVMISILKDMGINDFEPRVINQMLEFSYRYVTNILEDARLYSQHAKKKVIDIEDVKLSVQLQADQCFTSPPPRESLLELARTKNAIQLPLIQPKAGIRLPPDRHCLTATNYKLKGKHKNSSLDFSQSGPGGGSGKQRSRQPGGGQKNNTAVKSNPASFSVVQGNNKLTPTVETAGVDNNIGGMGGVSPAMFKIQVQPQTMTPGIPVKRKREDEDYDI